MQSVVLAWYWTRNNYIIIHPPTAILVPCAELPLAWHAIGPILLVSMLNLLESRQRVQWEVTVAQADRSLVRESEGRWGIAGKQWADIRLGR